MASLSIPNAYVTKGSLIVPLASTSTTLTVAMGVGDASATVASTAGFPAIGWLIVDAELMVYTGLTPTSFTGLSRGRGGSADSVAASHTLGAVVATPLLVQLGRFPGSGVIIVDSEQIAYTKFGDGGFAPLSGLTRGANGTTAAQHSAGADVGVRPSIACELRDRGAPLVGSGFLPLERIVVFIFGIAVFGRVSADAAGNFQAGFVVPPLSGLTGPITVVAQSADGAPPASLASVQLWAC